MNALEYVGRLTEILEQLKNGNYDADDAKLQIAKINAEAERSGLKTVSFTDTQLVEVEELYGEEEEDSSYEDESYS